MDEASVIETVRRGRVGFSLRKEITRKDVQEKPVLLQYTETSWIYWRGREDEKRNC